MVLIGTIGRKMLSYDNFNNLILLKQTLKRKNVVHFSFEIFLKIELKCQNIKRLLENVHCLVKNWKL